MDVAEAVRTRRTHKTYGSDPVPQALLDELFELARWAPNHHLSQAWRFRVLGVRALAALKAADPEKADKLDRAPTLVVASVLRTPGDPVRTEEDLLAAGCAAYIVLLGAHARGLAGYWRTPQVLRGEAGRRAIGLGPDEHAIGLLHLGPQRQPVREPGREPVHHFATYLD